MDEVDGSGYTSGGRPTFDAADAVWSNADLKLDEGSHLFIDGVGTFRMNAEGEWVKISNDYVLSLHLQLNGSGMVVIEHDPDDDGD